MKAILAFFKVLGQRLVSIDWPKAMGEAGVIVGLIVKVIADAKSKDFQSFFTDVESLPADIAILCLALRLSVSGNKEAIADPKLPSIVDPIAK